MKKRVTLGSCESVRLNFTPVGNAAGSGSIIRMLVSRGEDDHVSTVAAALLTSVEIAASSISQSQAISNIQAYRSTFR